MKTNDRGFTIVEVVVAMLILTVGLLGLASTAAMVTRMIGEGGRSSESASIAVQRMEILRSQYVQCTGLLGGKATDGSYQVAWEVAPATTTWEPAMRVRVMVTVPRPTQTARVDTFTTLIPC